MTQVLWDSKKCLFFGRERLATCNLRVSAEKYVVKEYMKSHNDCEYSDNSNSNRNSKNNAVKQTPREATPQIVIDKYRQ